MGKIYILKNTYWDDSDTRCNCLVYSTLEKAIKKLQEKKQAIIKSWEVSKDHIIDGVVTDRITDYENGFDVEELHYFLWGSRDWVFEYGYYIKETCFEVVKEAYNQCNYRTEEDYIEDLETIIDSDKSICCDFDLN